MAKQTKGNKNAELIILALAGIDAQIKELNEKKEELRQSLGHAATTSQSRSVAGRGSKKEAAPAKKKRVFSAATRKKLREAAKARWAREKETKQE